MVNELQEWEIETIGYTMPKGVNRLIEGLSKTFEKSFVSNPTKICLTKMIIFTPSEGLLLQASDQRHLYAKMLSREIEIHFSFLNLI